jgi:hypothetical protein
MSHEFGVAGSEALVRLKRRISERPHARSCLRPTRRLRALFEEAQREHELEHRPAAIPAKAHATRTCRSIRIVTPLFAVSRRLTWFSSDRPAALTVSVTSNDPSSLHLQVF